MRPSPSSDAGSVAGESEGVDESLLNGNLARLSSADLRYLKELRTEPPIGTQPLEEERERMRRGQTGDLGSFAVQMETYQTAFCPVHILRPREASGPLPVTFYFHGGGWTLGDLKTHAKLVSQLAIRSRSALAFMEYPLAPEHAYPAPLEACISAVAEVLRLGPSFGLDSNRCGFVGDSSGGNLCLAYAMLAKDRRLFVPQTQVLLYPAVDASLSLPSHHRFANNPNLGRQTMEWFWSNYVADVSMRESPLVSPLHAGEDAFAACPPTLIVSCEYDILRDEAEQMAARLIRAGVEVVAVRWLGVLHGFVVNEALSGSAAAQACVNFVAQHLVAAYDIGH
ncbi:MAG TPA: alpha/beta hydrolase [Acidobacteriaceae bacterium]|jgi:acetyl esterase/lipase